MKKHSAKLLTVIVLILSMTMSMGFAFGAETSTFTRINTGSDRNVSPYTITMITKSFYTVSSTKALAEVTASGSAYTPYVSSKITLQSAPIGSTSFTNVSGQSSALTAYEPAILHSVYFSITGTRDYRIKIELTDELNGIQTTVTTYKTLDR